VKEITVAYLRERAARYRELLSKTANAVDAARYREISQLLDEEAESLERHLTSAKGLSGTGAVNLGGAADRAQAPGWRRPANQLRN
jgi:hypothetical protein